MPKLLKKDVGTYTCRAENVYGSVMCAASVSISPNWEVMENFVAPEFVVTPQTAKVFDGQPVTFTCQVNSKKHAHNLEHTLFTFFLMRRLWVNPLQELCGITMINH